MTIDPKSLRFSGTESIKEAIQTYATAGTNFFKLDNDGDTATVIFLHTDDQDLDIYPIHEIEVGGKKVKVACLQGNGCPSCASGLKPKLEIFAHLLNITPDPKSGKPKNTVEVWERGSTMIPQFLTLIQDYGPLNGMIYKVTRNGKAKDPKTTYQMLPVVGKPGQPVQLPELPERPELFGGFVKLVDAEQMAKLLQGVDTTSGEAETTPVDRKQSGNKRSVPF